jgi:capsid portal protein
MNSKSLPFKKRENPLGTQSVSPVQTPVQVFAPTRDKYTATMDRTLRKRLKIASVEKGVVVSEFIEQAVIEKLEREGF